MAQTKKSNKNRSRVEKIQIKLDALPHDGREGFKKTINVTTKDGGKAQLIAGGQRLLIFLAVYVYKRFIAPVGRRFGKSTSLPFLIMEEARHFAGTYYALYVAQSHDKAYEMMDYVEQFFGGVRDPKKNPGGMVLRRVGGPTDQRRFLEIMPIQADFLGMAPELWPKNEKTRVYFVSGAHPHYEKIRGYPHPMHRIVLDETSLIHPKIRKVLTPMLADVGGRLLAIGTTDTDGLGNTQFRSYYKRGLSKDPKYATWGCMNFSSYANPTLTKEDFEEMINDCIDDDEVQQEIYAKFLEGRGAVFANLDNVLVLEPSLCNADREQWPEWMNRAAAAAIQARGVAEEGAKKPPDLWLHRAWNPAHSYVMSADWAKARDFTVFHVYDLTAMQQVAVMRLHGDHWTEQFVYAKALKDAYQAHEFHGDENTGAGEAMGDRLRAEYETGILGHRFGSHNKGAYVRNGQVIFYERRIALMNIPEQYEEFMEYQKFLPDTEKGQVRIRYGHPPGKHDDFVDPFLQVAETILDGARAKEEKKKPRGYTFVRPDGTLDPSRDPDNPTAEALDEYWEEQKYA